MALCCLLCTLGHELASSGLAIETANGKGEKYPQAKQSNKRSKDRQVQTFQLGHHPSCSDEVLLPSPLTPSSPHAVFDLLGLWEKQVWEIANVLEGAQDRSDHPLTPSACFSYPCSPTLKCCSNLKSRFAPSLLSSAVVFLGTG